MHNDIRAEVKMKEHAKTMERIKIWKRSHGSLITILACMRIASLTDYSTSKVAKLIVRHKIVSVKAQGCIS